jgi:hypothetical protein
MYLPDPLEPAVVAGSGLLRATSSRHRRFPDRDLPFAYQLQGERQVADL